MRSDCSVTVEALRNALDLSKLQSAQGAPQLFDVNKAHELYAALLGPVEEHR